MQMSGEYRIEAPREKVWEALNDPEVLKACITGCESLEKSADNQFDATVRAKVGPVSAKFNGSVELKDMNPPESYTISGSGKGGAAELSWRPGQCAGWCRAEASGEAAAEECALGGC